MITQEILDALNNGETVQYNSISEGGWTDVTRNSWKNLVVLFDREWRKKPKIVEFWVVFSESEPFCLCKTEREAIARGNLNKERWGFKPIIKKFVTEV